MGDPLNRIIFYRDVLGLADHVDADGNISRSVRHQLAANHRVSFDQNGSEVTRSGAVLYQNSVSVQESRSTRINRIVCDLDMLNDVSPAIWLNIDSSHALHADSIWTNTSRIFERIAFDDDVASIDNGDCLTGNPGKQVLFD